MTPVNRVIFHHEGAGAPTNNTARPLHEKYSIVIGVDTYQLANDPYHSFITTGTTGRSLQVVFTGNRDLFPVTDRDIELVRDAVAEAKLLLWVGIDPTVQLHGDTDATECPGEHVRERRADLEAAVRRSAVPPDGEDDLPYSEAQLRAMIAEEVNKAVTAIMRGKEAEGLAVQRGTSATLNVVRSDEYKAIIHDAAT